jgi:hypothetical protein
MSGHVLTITIASEKDAAGVAEDLLQRPSDWQSFVPALMRHLNEHTSGVRGARVGASVLSVSGAAGLAVSRTETVTIDQSKLTEGDTITIGPVSLEWVDSGPVSNQILIGDTDAECAATLAEALNASLLGAMLKAGASGAVTSVTVHGDLLRRALFGLSKSETTTGAMTLSAPSFTSSAEAAALSAREQAPETYGSGL